MTRAERKAISKAHADVSQFRWMGIGAHPDDLEIMAYEGISLAMQQRARRGLKNTQKNTSNSVVSPGFYGIIVSDGAKAPREGPYKKLSDAALSRLRFDEQQRAAQLGKYQGILQLGHPENFFSPRLRAKIIREISGEISRVRPHVIYTHQPFDYHPAHVVVMDLVLQAVAAVQDSERHDTYPIKTRKKSGPRGYRPQVIGCEVWGSLDWLPTKYRVEMDASYRPELARRLIACHRSQATAHKRYDLACEGRRVANSVFSEPKNYHTISHVILGIDLTSWIGNSRELLWRAKQIHASQERALRALRMRAL